MSVGACPLRVLTECVLLLAFLASFCAQRMCSKANDLHRPEHGWAGGLSICRVVFAASGQIFTAFTRRMLLRKRMSNRQMLAVSNDARLYMLVRPETRMHLASLAVVIRVSHGNDEEGAQASMNKPRMRTCPYRWLW